MSKLASTGLSRQDVFSIVNVLRSNPKIQNAVLFGSRALGTYSSGSDIDISLLGANLSLKDVLDVSIDLEELNLPYKFDLIIYERINEEALKEHIQRVGIQLYEL
ncbi:nucleotidyltransferase domain-containing protein [Carboxylicivirga mesophila]|uniref:Nucleotidyltransferase domain-containing protein n=1 Tax=Carboxylicivirga mesophila TaxID=1166478 RepID=A0ABS5KI64_9BACT|nr:nucleotidyltransferase domain-containing protein [Carboxylicivirga mesophila]MBS2214021.1 nucleotidyltransferase domain-containing protein [Carboxylicivirga mesophila]